MTMLLKIQSTWSFFEGRNIALTILALSGIGILVVWTRDILKGNKVDLSHGFFKAKDKESGSLFWPHWVAEYFTGIILLVGVFGQYFRASWGRDIAFLSLGALIYTSINSQSWALAKSERKAYAIPMGISLAGALIVLFVLL
jgi:hypothetical protein